MSDAVGRAGGGPGGGSAGETAGPGGERSFVAAYELLDALVAAGTEERTAVVEELIRHSSPWIRDRALAIGAEALPEPRLVAMLREEADDVRRNAGLEMLKRRGRRSLETAAALLADDDPDVVLQAILVLDHVGAAPVATTLAEAAAGAADPNVAHAAVVALGHGGDAAVLRALLPLLGGRPWLQIAAIEALGCLGDRRGIGPLAALLDHPLLGLLALDALGRIGGRRVFDTVSRRLTGRPATADCEAELGCLARALEGVAGPVVASRELLDRLRMLLDCEADAVRRAAACCLLACGPSPFDGAAIAMLGDEQDDGDPAPPCGLARRPDLAARLLRGRGRMPDWGRALVDRLPGKVGDDALAMLLTGDVGALELAGRALSRTVRPALALPLIAALLDAPPRARAVLGRALRRHRVAVRAALGQDAAATAVDRLVVDAWLGERPAATARAIATLPGEARAQVLPRLVGTRLAGRLPWAAWLAEDETLLALAVSAAVEGPCPELGDVLRPYAADGPLEVVRALGELADEGAVAALAGRLAGGSALDRAVVLEALGRIGGAHARTVLAAAVRKASGPERRLAGRALAHCCGTDELPLVRELAGDPDWVVRLAAAEALSRSGAAEDRRRLVVLAADPEAPVARAARLALERLESEAAR